MRKKAKMLSLIIFSVVILIASIMQLARLLNISETRVTSKEIQDIVASLGEGGFTAGDIDAGKDATHMYTYIDDAYCGDEIWQLRRTLQFSENGQEVVDYVGSNKKFVKQEVDYDLSKGKTINVPQCIAYARFCGLRDSALQEVVWASWQWSGYEDTCLHTYNRNNTISAQSANTAGRSYQFANFVYLALNDEGKLGLSYTYDNSQDLNILVNQNNYSYLVGPYTISIDHQGAMGVNGWNSTIENLVYQEIMGINPGENSSNQFCSGSISANVEFDDGTIRNESIQLVDENGGVINQFPEFGKEFYIRYFTDVDAELIKNIRPVINISYWTKFSGTSYTYRPSHIKYSMLQDRGDIIKNSTTDGTFLDVGVWRNWEDNQIIYSTSNLPLVLQGDEGNINMTALDNFARDITGVITNKLETEGVGWGLNVTNVDFDYAVGILRGDNFLENATVRTATTINTCTRYTCSCGATFYSCDSGYAEAMAEHQRLNQDNPGSHEIVSSTTLYYYNSRLQLIQRDGTGGFTTLNEINSLSERRFFYGIDQAKEDALYRQNTYFNNANLHIAMKFKKIVIDEDIENIQSAIQFSTVQHGGDSESIALQEVNEPGFNMFLGGNVFQALPSDKLYEYGNRKKDGDLDFGGIQVQLVDMTPESRNYLRVMSTTTTDAQGEYGFQKLNPMHKYKVVFTYDGMRFENIDYSNNLSGNYSTASELLTGQYTRRDFNNIFAEISTSPQNYYKDGEWRKAYGIYTKIENGDGDYIWYNQNTNIQENSGSFRYYDALQIFKDLTTNSHNFNETNSTTMIDSYYILKDAANQGYNTFERTFKNRLRDIGVSTGEQNNIWKFMMDTMISASTVAYPEQDQFVLKDIDDLKDRETYVMRYPYLYIRARDQSRQVDFGIRLREVADVDLLKDLYKATIIVNTKQEVYKYNKKQLDSSGRWEVNLDTGTYQFTGGSVADNRARNSDYIGEQYGGNVYSREVRKSDYLYDGSDAGTTDIKNLQVFVTYKIRITNKSQAVHVNIPEIVDYYDSDQFEFNRGYTIINDNTYLGDSRGNKVADISVSNTSTYVNHYGNDMNNYYRNSNHINNLYNYSSLYITGIRSASTDSYQDANILRNGEDTYLYITFKVNNDPATGKVKIDQEINGLLNGNTEGIDQIGKRNIAEINGYKTYYRNVIDNRGVYSTAGVIDQNSNPGSLKAKDMNPNGDIISSEESWVNRLENDSDKASNLKLKIDTNNNDTRTFSGYVFEDARTQISNDAVIGNGVYNEADIDVQGNSDKKINGVTVELVELVPECDSQGFSTGRYVGEKIWSSINYNYNGSGFSGTLDNSRYYSGTNSSKVILSGQGVFAVNPSGLTINQGEYKYESLPPGDFFIKFTYGDTSQTVLTNQANEVNNLLENVGPDGLNGLNSISYNGQDYKSTIYQRDINQSSTDMYNGIMQYVDTNIQNYNVNNANDKSAMYYYDIAKSQNVQNVSDAKDVYTYRNSEILYSKGSNVNSQPNGEQTLKNHRAEVLASATQFALKTKNAIENGETNQAKDYQNAMIRELINNTRMVAQTGVINTEVEYNRQNTEVGTDNLNYHVQDLDLGLTERPEAQLALSKELTNIQVRLASGQILFDTTQSVDNLSYGSHYTHTNVYEQERRDGLLAYRLRKDIANEQKTRSEELVTAYMDEELMSGATIRLTYKLNVDNIGEVDYLDTQFYYLGSTSNTNWNNISRTNARRVIDYISNEMNYTAEYQEDTNNWTVVTANLLFGGNRDNEDDDLVNTVYEENLNTFNVLVTTNKLSDELVPRAIDNTEDFRYSRKEVSLILSTLLTNTIQNENLAYTNLTEILESSNTLGRRMQLSKAGNQVMPYQSDEDRSIDDSTTWIHPEEVDSDSGQKVQVLIPTGENKDYNRIIVISICALALIGLSAFMIRNKI